MSTDAFSKAVDTAIKDGIIFEIVLLLLGVILILGTFMVGGEIFGIKVPSAGAEKYVLTSVGILMLAFALLSSLKKQKAQLVNQISKDIEVYWGFRPLAVEPMSSTLKEAESSIFIAGMGLNSLDPILNESTVVSAISEKINKNPDFKLTLMFANTLDSYPHIEQERSNLPESIRSGKNVLIKFLENIYKSTPKKKVTEQIRLLEYKDGMFPRHFLLKTSEQNHQNVIYCGSYLTHKQGKHSYLLKLRDHGKHGEGLYTLFDEEIKHLLASAKEVDPESISYA